MNLESISRRMKAWLLRQRMMQETNPFVLELVTARSDSSFAFRQAVFKGIFHNHATITNICKRSDGSSDDLAQEVFLLLVKRRQRILAAIKKAGYEIPADILRTIQEFQRAVYGSGFFDATIKTLFLPLRLIPKSLHPNEIAA